VAIAVISDLEFGGAQRQVVELANHMDPARFDLHVVSLNSYTPLAHDLRDARRRLHIVRRRGKFDFTVATRLSKLARELGAAWTGRAEEDPPARIHSAVIFAPAGPLVPEALRVLRKGGVIALAGIYMSPIPSLEYSSIYHERTLRSVANSTRQDAHEILRLAGEIPIRTEIETFALEEANEALLRLKESRIRGAGVLIL